MVTIPSSSQATLEAQGPTEWPAPPAWTTSEPATTTIALIPGSGQFQATLSVTAATSFTVTVDSGSLQGVLAVDVVDGAAAPPDPIAIALA